MLAGKDTCCQAWRHKGKEATTAGCLLTSTHTVANLKTHTERHTHTDSLKEKNHNITLFSFNKFQLGRKEKKIYYKESRNFIECLTPSFGRIDFCFILLGNCIISIFAEAFGRWVCMECHRWLLQHSYNLYGTCWALGLWPGSVIKLVHDKTWWLLTCPAYILNKQPYWACSK